MKSHDASLAVESSTSLKPDETATLSQLVRPLGQGTLFAVAFGIALGIGTTQGHILGLALAVPLTFAVSIIVAIPSLFVVLSMLEAPLELDELLKAAANAYRYGALTLGGLSPTLLLMSSSIDNRAFVYHLGCSGLVLAASLGAYRLLSDTYDMLRKHMGIIKTRHVAVIIAFIGLSFEIATRIWDVTFAWFGGQS